ncbi:hypothetical protein [Deinococcus multiflagellatus]|uniref:Uncharacterized protein n=1 Tax=Deinococcus multiflagellatus TaxID=1656887 RepID=A0ABW1ZET2_9DEIO|nr:hypothetical protein [Deinococcus multiflagellatus]MBZ9712226.1 hypothetical protein [Deinococcus multiflagellatus]
MNKVTRAQLIANLKAAGVIALQCEDCGYKHPLTRLGFGCNAAHPDIDGETCDGWNLKEVRSTVKPARVLAVPFQPVTVQGGAA